MLLPNLEQSKAFVVGYRRYNTYTINSLLECIAINFTIDGYKKFQIIKNIKLTTLQPRSVSLTNIKTRSLRKISRIKSLAQIWYLKSTQWIESSTNAWKLRRFETVDRLLRKSCWSGLMTCIKVAKYVLKVVIAPWSSKPIRAAVFLGIYSTSAFTDNSNK